MEYITDLKKAFDELTSIDSLLDKSIREFITNGAGFISSNTSRHKKHKSRVYFNVGSYYVHLYREVMPFAKCINIITSINDEEEEKIELIYTQDEKIKNKSGKLIPCIPENFGVEYFNLLFEVLKKRELSAFECFQKSR